MRSRPDSGSTAMTMPAEPGTWMPEVGAGIFAAATRLWADLRALEWCRRGEAAPIDATSARPTRAHATVLRIRSVLMGRLLIAGGEAPECGKFSSRVTGAISGADESRRARRER